MKKKIITAVMCFAIAMIFAQVAPNKTICNTARAAETDIEEFNGASGISWDLKWEITSKGHLTVTGKGDYKQDFSIELPEWLDYREYIKTAKINVRDITSASGMFCGCNNLTSIDLSSLKTDNVLSMNSMFEGCSSLTNLNLTSFKTDNVINMQRMFEKCTNLKNLNLSSFKTDNVTDMALMFEGCSSLTSLDLSSFNTSNVDDMQSMFENCSSLTSLNLKSFKTDNVMDMASMFEECSSLVSLDLSSFNTNYVRYMGGMFSGCSALTSLDISNFNTILAGGNVFSFADLCSLEKLNFFADSSRRYNLPSSIGYYWINDVLETVTQTAKDMSKKVTYYRIKNGEPAVIPTPTPIPNNDINTGIYADAPCVSLAPVSVRTLFVYGGNVKQTDESKINYKSKTYYTNLQASNIVTTDSKGKTRTKKGKLVAGVTSTDIKPSLVKGKISKDVAASKIAKVSISKGKVKVTAGKESGVVYVWVIDTGDIGDYVCAKFIVNAAPSKLQVFARASSDAAFSADKKNVYKKDVVEIGDSVRLYVYPTYKQNGQFKETKDASYSASVNSQAASYFTVTQDESNPYCFIVTANGLKNNKKTTGKVTIKCNENGRKTVFTAVAVNGIQSISFDSVSGMTLDSASGAAITSYVIERSDTDKKIGSFAIATSKSSDSFDTTDKVKIYAMNTADGFDKSMMEKGRVRITSKPSGNQKKLTTKVGNDKKTITVTAAKKIPAQTSVYYLVFYNNKQGKGYSVVKITTK